MKCYREGGCGPYEMYSCSKCPWSKKEYYLKQIKKEIKEECINTIKMNLKNH